MPSKKILGAKRLLRHTYTYFVTIQGINKKDYITKNLLDETFESIQKVLNLEVVKTAYELGSQYKQLHMHAMVCTKRYFKYSDFSKMGGLRLYWRKIYNYDTLIDYLSKQDSTSAIHQNEINAEYAFTDP